MSKWIDRWDREYSQGAHWEKEASSQAKGFAAKLQAGDKVLDAGCGSGRDSLFFAQAGFDVTGVDLSKVAIEKATAQAAERGLNARFEVWDLEKLNFPDSSFTAVYSGYALQNTDVGKSIPELARVLLPGALAKLAILEATKYENGGEYDQEMNHNETMRIIFEHFDVISQVTDEYEESDQHGKHKHKRLVLELRKR